MSLHQIAVIVGSLRKESINLKLSHALIKLGSEEYNYKHVQIDDIPLYNQDDDQAQALSVIRLKKEISSANGVLFVTPEYNRSIPGVLKNILDHGSRPYGTSCWAGKPAAIIGASNGAIGTALAQAHLRLILSYLNMPVLCQPEAYIQFKEGLIDEDGNIGQQSKEFLKGWLGAFETLVKLHN